MDGEQELQQRLKRSGVGKAQAVIAQSLNNQTTPAGSSVGNCGRYALREPERVRVAASTPRFSCLANGVLLT